VTDCGEYVLLWNSGHYHRYGVETFVRGDVERQAVGAAAANQSAATTTLTFRAGAQCVQQAVTKKID